MKTIALTLILALFVSGCSHNFDNDANDVVSQDVQEAAQKAADQWLALVDAGSSSDSWKASATYFQKSVSQDLWTQKMATDRKPLGDLLSRRFKSAEYARHVPGGSHDQFIVLEFDSSFENKPRATEIVTPMLDKDGEWKVAGYYIR